MHFSKFKRSLCVTYGATVNCKAVVGTIPRVPETSGFFPLAHVKSSTLKLPDITIALVTAVSSHHTFRSEMPYLNRNSSSICHPCCHHWSAWKSASTCPPPSISPVPNFVPQLFRHPDSSPNLTCVNADSQLVHANFSPAVRSACLSATCPFTRAKGDASPVSFWR